MTRINVFRKTAAPRDSVAWGKDSNTTNIATAVLGNANALIFAAVLIVCSVAVGCSSDKPKPVNSNNQIPVTQPQAQPQAMPAPVMQAENKPAPKKPVVHKKPATVNYTDKTYGVTFEYPRRYAIETGDAAADLLLSNPIPMNFVQPGGVALAAVELPETNYANTDFSSAFFNVSVHKTLTADQCNEFSVPQSKSSMKPEPAPATPSSEAVKPEVAKQDSTPKPEPKSDSKPDAQPSAATQPAPSSDPSTTVKASATPSTDPSSNSKLMLGDMELRATEAVSGEGTRQSDSKYFHLYQNGACYEFALNVTTVASEQGVTKHVDRDKVFNRLEQILSTVKISPVTPEVTAEAPAPAAPETPAQ
ncbi:MAG TPA: hypothetical protein VE377_25835 [Candidatus Dormibacteraeota bacterium]|nr:hypothetical protein [Candidatus Dormibacteraeota bacterium]